MAVHNYLRITANSASSGLSRLEQDVLHDLSKGPIPSFLISDTNSRSIEHLRSLGLVEYKKHSPARHRLEITEEGRKALADHGSVLTRFKTAGADTQAVHECMTLMQHAEKVMQDTFKKVESIQEPVQRWETHEVFQNLLKKHVLDCQRMVQDVGRLMKVLEEEEDERRGESHDYSEKF